MKLNTILETVEEQIKSLSTRLNKSPDYVTTISKKIGGKFWKWVLNQWEKRIIRLPEDEYRLIEALKNFNKYKNQLPSRDINYYKNISFLEEAIEEAYHSKKEASISDISREGVEIINEHNGFTVIKITDAEALKDLGEGTKWCTRRSYPNCMAESYLNDHGYINMIILDGRPIVQYTPDLFQVMGVKDTTLETVPEIVDGVKNGSLDLFSLIIPDYGLIFKNLTADKSVLYSDSEVPLASEQSSVLKLFFRILGKNLGFKGDIPGFEKLILAALGKNRGHLLAAHYANFIKRDRWPEVESYIVNRPVSASYYAKNSIKGRWPEAEESILNSLGYDSSIVFDYAADVIKGRWPEAEALILKSNKMPWIVSYSQTVIKGRWLEGEERLLKIAAKAPEKKARYLVFYAVKVMNMNNNKSYDEGKTVRWSEAEPLILQSQNHGDIRSYASVCTNGWPAYEDLLMYRAKNLNPDSEAVNDAVSYVQEVTSRRWPELEELLKDLYNNRHRYRLNERVLFDRVRRYKNAIYRN